MGRNLWYKLLGALLVLVAAVLWILSLTVPEKFGFFSLAWAGVIICGGLGLILILQGCFQKNANTIKKLKIWFGIVLVVCGVLCLVSELAIPGNLVIPIIAIVVAVGLIITIIASRGSKWDEGDNHKAGYKNYHERKAEEEKKAAEENKEEKK